MGWGYGINNQGREVGYTVEAVCDQEGCQNPIDRGLYYVCGDMHDGGEHGCGGYFCGTHLLVVFSGPRSHQLCLPCAEAFELREIQNP